MSIKKYALSAKKVYKVLKKKNLSLLYHANTLSTSVTFIEEGALLSRHYVEKKGLFQTEQKSDNEDRKFDVWNHIFLDGTDLHSKFNRANKYGPILFVLKLKVLKSRKIRKVYITKSNPWYWTESTPLNQRFYKNVKDVEDDYLTSKKLHSQIMFTIRKPKKSLKLSKYLVEICLDKPNLKIKSKSGRIDVGTYAENILRAKLDSSGLSNLPILPRHKSWLGRCVCAFNYNFLYHHNKEEFARRFRNF